MRVSAMITMLVAIAFGAGGTGFLQGASTPALPEAERISLPDQAGEALYWRGGTQAVLLAHGAVYDAESWTDQARAMQADGYSVLALESISADAITTGITWLRDEQHAAGVVVIGASAGGSGALNALADRPERVVGLVLLSATGSVEELGDYPKLFTASKGEGMADRLKAMADNAPGDNNRVEIIPGNAHAQATFRNPEGAQLLDAVLQFLGNDANWPAENGTPAV